MRLFAGTPFDRPPQCDRCGQLEAACTCPPPEPARLAPQQQTARLAVEKRTKGKLVTVIRGLTAEHNDLPDLLSKLKSICGAGGTIKGEELEIQGSHLDRLREALLKLGNRVR